MLLSKFRYQERKCSLGLSCVHHFRSFYCLISCFLFWVRPIVLQEYFADQHVDLACVTKTWVSEGEMVALKELPPPGYSVLHQSQTSRWGVVFLIWEYFSFRVLPTPKIFSIDCVGLMLDAEESLAVWLVYQPPSAIPDSLSNLLEVVAGWAMEFLRILILRDFNVHANDTTNRQAQDLVSAMAMLGLHKIVLGLTHQAGHMLDLVFGMGMDMDMISVEQVPWSDHCPKSPAGCTSATLSRLQADFNLPVEIYGSYWRPECSAGSTASWWFIRWADRILELPSHWSHWWNCTSTPSMPPLKPSFLVYRGAQRNEAKA